MKRFTGKVAALIAIFFCQSLCYARITFPKAGNGAPAAIVRKQLFDDSWKFFLGDIPEARSKDFKDEGWRKLNLPHDWSIEGNISPKNPTGGDGGYFPAGIGWYRKTFNWKKEKGQQVFIRFDGVYMNSDVWINACHRPCDIRDDVVWKYCLVNVQHRGVSPRPEHAWPVEPERAKGRSR